MYKTQTYVKKMDGSGIEVIEYNGFESLRDVLRDLQSRNEFIMIGDAIVRSADVLRVYVFEIPEVKEEIEFGVPEDFDPHLAESDF